MDSKVPEGHLYDLQLKLEERMLTVGMSRFNKNNLAALPSTTVAGISVLKGTVTALEDALKAYLIEAYEGKAGRGNRHTNAKLLSLVKPDVAAYLCLKVTIDHLNSANGITATAMSIAGRLEDEFKFTLFRTAEPRLFESVKGAVSKRTSNRHYMRYNLIHSMNKNALITYEPWSKTEKLHMGVKLIDLMIQHTGLVKKATIRLGGKRTKLILEPTDITLSWIAKVNQRTQFLMPNYGPCVIPPREWTNPYDGGYWSKHIKPLLMVKTKNRYVLEELANQPMPLEYKALNALQNTQWVINKGVFSVLEQIWENGGGWAGVPPRESVPIPICPLPKSLDKKDMTPEQLDTLVKWKRRAANAHTKNAQLDSKRLALIRTIGTCRDYLNLPLYYVYQNDFRFRKYAVSSFVNPQGPDYSKALLLFGEGKAIETQEASDWLCVQGANTYGNDKVTFDERVRWVKENEESIILAATDPLTHKWWSSASDPFQFLSFCMEYAQFKRVGWGFISHLPIALDGRNNGLQHLSALGLDEVGGKATCLIPSEVPEDMYQNVYISLWDTLQEDSLHPMAQLWLEFGGSRKTVKRPIMVIPYGGTKFACRDYIADYVEEQLGEGATDVFKDDFNEAVTYLAAKLWTVANEAVPAARVIMKYLQDIGKILSKEDIPVVWDTPTGAWIHQLYPNTKPMRITTKIDGTLIKPQIRVAIDGIDRARSVNGIAPNFVHGNDGACMTITICKAVDVGIKSFAMIHDSYGVHAADTSTMARLIREAFVEVYSVDQLAKFAAHAEELGFELPTPPPKGSLDIKEVINSKYFFA